ncbi:ATP-binding cassette domain-containing protein [Vicingus serpentipes]|uniref:ATP-binding cassette domain-containing protein n=1 Tax=Vicingus serpentipes TaxID=1926625 RepID=A0A5C6RX15_9FLAO|nr:ATP-binding cassette domain-containing protein [Vicingus serpentipes]TXB66634.1 ATP-binding cassette domain-containing protein [Vicingus serpentipes]
MSERILKALMQLFSIVSDTEELTANSRNIVESFLKQQLNQQLVKEYLRLYDDFIEAKNKKSEGSKRKKRTSVNSVKVLLICTQINEELAQKQKIIVLIRLIEFIYANNHPSEQELEFINTVSETFNIPPEEFNHCLEFTKKSIDEKFDSPCVLVINSKKENELKESKHIYSEGINGELRILKIETVNLFFVRYYGDSELYMNGILINKTRSHILSQGSSIRSSRVQPIYYSDIISSYFKDDNAEKIVFNVDGLTYKFKGGNYGMHHFSFSEESGHMVGIMGASGAGKSTLLNLLNGAYIPTTGQITINGIDIHHEPDKIEGVIGYVSQDDLLIEELTVFQNLFYNAKLCFDNLNEAQITKRVLDVLLSIGLLEAKDLKVGSPMEKTISGGQRKRLNIALELIREPAVLFVDEPTSGLSSRDSENIMDLLKELALKGKLVFVVIHQPSSDIFKMFDNLLILDTGGYPIYNGNPVDAVIYFKELVNHVNSNESECVSCGNVNSEQIFNIIESRVVDEYGNPTLNRKISPQEWYQFYLDKIEKSSSTFKRLTTAPNITFSIPNKIKQFKVFIIRDVLSKLTNKQYMLINFLEAPVLAFILSFLVRYFNADSNNELGYIFRENENLPAYIFMSVIVALFVGLTVSAEEIIRDQKIRKREKFLNLSKGSYLFSKISIMFAISAIQTFTFIIIGNSILGIDGMNVAYWLVLFSTACFANMLGLNISASFNSAVTIYILIPFLVIPQLLLSGVIVKFDKLNPTITLQDKVPVVGEIMTSRWAYEALAVHQFKDNKFEKQFYKLDKELKVVEFKKNFWLAKLREKLSSSQNYLNDETKKEELVNNFELLRNEIGKEIETNTEIKFADLDKLYIDKVNETVFTNTKNYFLDLNNYYLQKYKNANNSRDKLASKLNKDKEARDLFIEMKDRYTNDALSDFVKDKNELNKIIELDNHLIQKADPIYLSPDDFRAHFYAPEKKIFGVYIDTFWVNIAIIWLMSIFLSITLYFDALKNLIDGLEKVFEKFKK